jgi:simple sugar transport system permease protein
MPQPFSGGAFVQAVTHPMVLGTVLAVAFVSLLLRRTVFGLRLRAVGERPDAARTLGVAARPVRVIALLLGGALAGLGGAYLAVEQRQFVAGMSAGRGYIALAAMIFGGWRPVFAVLACLLFATAEAMEIQLQTLGNGFPAWAVQMLPYVLTIVVLAGMRGTRARAPAALGRPL